MTPAPDLKALARAVLDRQRQAGRACPTVPSPGIWDTGQRRPTSVPLSHRLGRGTRDSAPRPWDGDDWREYFEERAAIAEHDGKLPRHRAEGAAWESTIAEWCRRNPPRLTPGLCAACGASLDLTGHGWRPLGDGATVHYVEGLACWRGYGAQRRAAAVEALNSHGIKSPSQGDEEVA